MASKREALIASAEKSLQKGKPDAALKDYVKVLEESPADINILNKVGDLYVRLGRNDESIPFFLRIAEHYAKDGFYVRAIAMYKKINKLDPARLDIYEKLAELYVKQQLWMEAKSNYQVLADYLLKQDNLQGAIGIYGKMVAIEPQNLQLHVKLADLFTQGKRIPEALREYGVVAAALSERGAHEEAIRVYEKALRLAPDNVDILKTLVPLLLSINSVEQARIVLRKGLEASPRSVPLFLLSAEAALAANDMAEARSYSEKACAVEPDNEDALAAVVKIQLKGRRPDLAWAAAGPLADAAMRKGEAKKALALLVPIARAAPDVDDLVKKVVDIAAGIGDEATALPFRSALAELYRKKGKLAEAADLLRHCSRIQPDNAEFRARLAQLEPQSGAATVSPGRVPPPSLERKMEVTLSGFESAPVRVPAPLPAPVPAPVPAPEAVEAAEEFEFDLDEVEVVEAAPEPAPVERAEVAPPTPPRGLAVPHPVLEAESEPAWNSLSAREALEAYEASHAGEPQAPPPAAYFEVEEAEELQPGAELPQANVPQAPDLSALDLSLATPEGFGPSLAVGEPSFQIPPVAATEPPEVEWPSTVLPPAEPPVVDLEEAYGVSGAFPRPVSADSELEDALVEADVFRRYGLLEKAVDQLSPWLEKAPGNLRIRERLFEIHLEHGDREQARAHAVILAEAYAEDGREDRIRGLEALLGEPVREVPAEEPVPPEVEAVPEEFRGAAEFGVEEGAALPEELAEAAPRAAPETFVEAGLELAEAAAPGEAQAPDFRQTLPAEFGEPLTEVISPIPTPLPFAPEPVALEPPPDAAAAWFEAPAPVPEGLEPVVETPVAPEPLEPAAPAPFVVPEGHPTPRPRLSAEDLLDLGRKGPAAPRKKVKAVRPEDVELDLLGQKARPTPRPKPLAKPESLLPDDLLASIRRPATGVAPKAGGGPSLQPPPDAALPELPPPAPFESEAARDHLPLEPESFAASAEELPVPPPEAPALPAQPSADELAGLDFCLDQGMVVDAAERLQSLEGRFPGDPELAARRLRLEGGRGGGEVPRAALHDILSDDLDSVLDAQLGRALTEDMVRDLPAPTGAPAAHAGAPVLDESGLFSDEQEFFNFADELHTELRREGEVTQGDEGREVSLEEIFRDFKKGVEQQLSPEDYETHYNLGIAYKEMGLTDEAIGEFQLAAKDPLHAVECCAMLGLCFLEKGLPQLAIKWYRKGLETVGVKDDDRLGLQYAIAGVLEQIGDREGAYRAYLEIFGASASYRDVADRIRELKPFVAS